MEDNKAVDPRTKKTKRAIRNAFAKLLSEHDINDITVRDIAELAEINRKTFYRYYCGIYQVVDEIEDEIIIAFESVLGDVDFRRDMKDPYRIFERLTTVINTDLDFYGHLLSMRGNGNLVSKVVSLLKTKTKETMLKQIDLDDRIAEVIVDFVFSGMLSVYQQWFVSNHKESIEEIAKIVSIMSLQGFTGIVERYNTSL